MSISIDAEKTFGKFTQQTENRRKYFKYLSISKVKKIL